MPSRARGVQLGVQGRVKKLNLRIRVAHLFLRWEARSLEKLLTVHVEHCQHRLCRHVDLENCDETSFCKTGNALFVRYFNLTEASTNGY